MTGRRKIEVSSDSGAPNGEKTTLDGTEYFPISGSQVAKVSSVRGYLLDSDSDPVHFFNGLGQWKYVYDSDIVRSDVTTNNADSDMHGFLVKLSGDSDQYLDGKNEWGLKVKAGTYTPTRSAEVNLDSNVTTLEAQYMRVGNTVTVSGRFTADPTTTTLTTSFEITLPIASNIGAVEDVAGVAFCGNIVSMGAEIIGVVANDTAKVQWKASDVTSQTWSYTFTYQVI